MMKNQMAGLMRQAQQMQDNMKKAQEELANQMSEEANRRMYVLSIVAAIFLPLGFFTGLLGINVGGMPGADNGWAFWVVCGICVTVVVWEVLLFRKKRWL